MTLAARLRDRIEIQTPAFRKNELQEGIPTFHTARTVWAEVAPVGARDTLLAQSYASTVNHKITVRRTAEPILPTHRIKFGVRIFAVAGSIDPPDNRAITYVFCNEIVGGAG